MINMEDVVQYAVEGCLEDLEKIVIYDKSVLKKTNSVSRSNWSYFKKGVL